jgi:hypothetical protein
MSADVAHRYSPGMVDSVHTAGRAMVSRVFMLVASLTIIAGSPCVGDQLQWNAFRVCEEAARVIGRQPVLVSYCSLADEDHVELWSVSGLGVVDTPVEGLFEVLVLAKPLYRSQHPFSPAEFPVPDDEWAFNEVRDPEWSAEGIDLAYVYVHVGGNSFQCLGKALGLECRVGVETRALPEGLMEKIATGRSSGHLNPLRMIGLAPERYPVPPSR